MQVKVAFFLDNFRLFLGFFFVNFLVNFYASYIQKIFSTEGGVHHVDSVAPILDPALIDDPALIGDPIKVLTEDSVLGPRLQQVT